MAKQRGFGRRYARDDDDRQYLMRRRLARAGTVLPTRKTWRIGPPNLDQGNTGTCVGQSWHNFMRSAPIRSVATAIPAFEIYDACILIDEWDDNNLDPERQFGTSVRAGAKVLTSRGRLKSYVWAFALQPAVEWVLTQGPVVLGTNWYSSFTPDAEGIVKITPSATVQGGHAYLWRGVDTRRGLALCSNSWGDDWGQSGDFLIPLRDLERLIHEQGEVCSAIEARLAPKAVMPPRQEAAA